MNFHSLVDNWIQVKEYTIVNYHDKLSLVAEMTTHADNELTGTSLDIMQVLGSTD